MSGEDPRREEHLDVSRENRLRGEAMVSFVQATGNGSVRWTVAEVVAAGVPGARGPRCLVFTREDSCIRRVWEYPANWRTLDDAALAALSWRR